MSTATKGSQVRVYLQDADFQILARLTEITEFGQGDICSRLLACALRAIEADGMKIEFPLRMQVKRDSSPPPSPRI